MRLRLAACLGCLVVTAMAAFAWPVRNAEDPVVALAGMLARVTDDASGPRVPYLLRSACWLQSAPGQPAGPDPVVAMPDAVAGTERIITARELRAAVRLIAGLPYDQVHRRFGADASSAVPLDQVRDSLLAAVGHPDDAEAVLDLLTGLPTQAGSQAVGRLRAGDLPDGVRCVSCQGVAGLVLRSQGGSVIRPYRVVMLRFEGPGWPSEWRPVRIEAVGAPSAW